MVGRLFSFHHEDAHCSTEWWVGYFRFNMRMHTVLHMLYPLHPVIIVRIMTKTDDIFILHVLHDHVDTDVPIISVCVQHM